MEVKVNDLVFIGRHGNRATRSFKHFFSARWESMFGPRPPSSPAHWTTIPSHWAWESGLCKSRQSGLNYSPAQKQAGVNTVESGDECPAFLSNSAEEEEKDGAGLSGRKCYSSFFILNVLLPCFLCSFTLFFLHCCVLSLLCISLALRIAPS